MRMEIRFTVEIESMDSTGEREVGGKINPAILGELAAQRIARKLEGMGKKGRIVTVNGRMVPTVGPDSDVYIFDGTGPKKLAL